MSGFARFVPILMLGLAVGLAPASAAGPDKANKLGSSGNWSAFTRSAPGGTVCYAHSKPVETVPAKAKRGDIYILINDWPSRKVKGEIQISFGYPFKEGTTVTVSVGTLKVDFFTKSEGGDGYAWVADAGDEQKLLNAMRKGARVVVEGTSKRGTKTKDTYSLKGISAVLDMVHQSCAQ